MGDLYSNRPEILISSKLCVWADREVRVSFRAGGVEEEDEICYKSDHFGEI